jgi:hypothetical protein
VPSTTSQQPLFWRRCRGTKKNNLPRQLGAIKRIRVLFALKPNKAAGTDGLPAEFYQVFWEVVKDDLKEMFDAFHSGDLDIERLNHGVISLIKKVPGAIMIQKFSPICLLNVS